MFDQILDSVNNISPYYSLLTSTSLFTLMIIINAKYGYLTRIKSGELTSFAQELKDKGSLSVPPKLFFAIWGVIYVGLIALYGFLWNNKNYVYVSKRNYNKNYEYNVILFFLNIVHILNCLWILLNNLPKENIKVRLIFQTLVIYLMVFFLFLTYENINNKFNILSGNVITLYLGWVICASFVSTILSIYVFYPKINKLSKYLGFIWVAIAIKYFMSKYDPSVLDIKDICLVFQKIQPINYGFYGAVLWGLVGVLLSK
jgi:hypothetical protein